MNEMYDRYLILEMYNRALAINPSYPGDLNMDGRPLLKIAEFIYNQMKLDRGVENNAYAILPVWEQLYTVAHNDPFYSDKSLATISNHIQEFFQKAKNGKPGELSGAKLKDKLAARFKK